MLIDNHYYKLEEIKGNKIIARKTLHKITDIEIYNMFAQSLDYARNHGITEHQLYLKCYKLLHYMESYRKESPLFIEFYRYVKDNNPDNWYKWMRIYKNLNTYQDKFLASV